MYCVNEQTSSTQWKFIFTRNTTCEQWKELLKSPSLHSYESGSYAPPSFLEIRTLINRMHWSEEHVAKLIGAPYNTTKGRGSNTVRGWLRPPGTAGSRNITYASWRLLLINAKFADA